ncbi:hypothetical protein B0T17DRAFT_535285 [Bombardia bombarda]|uniref:Uncharacterized protein n=1 Tax=Bombardia bombarda TaxID=252184 RepID=A0AA39WUI6_9PEZI|nr:hypothetical protein B0T17DRAFT_535285 [Bombardia bombarda]
MEHQVLSGDGRQDSRAAGCRIVGCASLTSQRVAAPRCRALAGCTSCCGRRSELSPKQAGVEANPSTSGLWRGPDRGAESVKG